MNFERHNGLQDQDYGLGAQGRPSELPDPIPSDYYFKLFNTQFVPSTESMVSSTASGAFPSLSKATIGFAKEPEASRVPSVVALSGIVDDDVSEGGSPWQQNVDDSKTAKDSPWQNVNDFQAVRDSPQIQRNINPFDLKNVDMSIAMGFPPRGLEKLATMNLDPHIPSLIKEIPANNYRIQQQFVSPNMNIETYPKMHGVMGIGNGITGGHGHPVNMPEFRYSLQQPSLHPWQNIQLSSTPHQPFQQADLSKVIEMETPIRNYQQGRESFRQDNGIRPGGISEFRSSLQRSSLYPWQNIQLQSPNQPFQQTDLTRTMEMETPAGNYQRGRESFRQDNGTRPVAIGGESRPGGIPEQINVPSDVSTDFSTVSTFSNIEGF